MDNSVTPQDEKNRGEESIKIPDTVFVALKSEQTLRQTLIEMTLFDDERWKSLSLLSRNQQITHDQRDLAENVYQLLRNIARTLIQQAPNCQLNIWENPNRFYVLLYYFRMDKKDYAWVEMLRNGSLVLNIFSPMRVGSIYSRPISESEDLLHIFSEEILQGILAYPQSIFNTLINNSSEFIAWYQAIIDSRESRRKVKKLKK